MRSIGLALASILRSAHLTTPIVITGYPQQRAAKDRMRGRGKYDGAKLREIRAVKGVGRPPR